jgi:hypothetical protein
MNQFEGCIGRGSLDAGCVPEKDSMSGDDYLRAVERNFSDKEMCNWRQFFVETRKTRDVLILDRDQRLVLREVICQECVRIEHEISSRCAQGAEDALIENVFLHPAVIDPIVSLNYTVKIIREANNVTGMGGLECLRDYMNKKGIEFGTVVINWSEGEKPSTCDAKSR